ncbi:MAG: ABC transporter ATP-binding protein [Acidilobaceae archaeon]
MSIIVSMKDIVKIYPDGTIALRGVDLDIFEGEVHALLGENGAGKTTLMRILYGEIQPTRGELYFRGERVQFKSPRDAMSRGIAMVYQNFSLIPNFTILENLYLAVSSIRKVSLNEVKARAEELLSRFKLKIPLDYEVENLPVGFKQRIEIVKALLLNAKVLILDEPTSVLTPLEIESLFNTINDLKREGVTIIYITHKLKEVKSIADRVTILRRGLKVGTFNATSISEHEMAKLMIDRDIKFTIEKPKANPGEVVLRVRNLSVRDDMGVLRVKDVSFDLRAGEILGVVGVQGSGQKELLEAIAGMRRYESGTIEIKGVDISKLNVRDIRRLGLSYIPESKLDGLAYDMSIVENSILSKITDYISMIAGIDWGKARFQAKSITEKFSVVYKALDDKIKFLSGGNQQKFMVGRELIQAPYILLAHEPTQGLDVASASMVKRELIQLKSKGSAILLISSDLDEVLELSDKVIVLFEGRIVGEGDPRELGLEKIALLMGGYV